MKKTLRLVGVAAMVLLLAASCKKDEKNNGETQRMTFTAGIEQGNSKTGLTPNGSHAFNQVWSEGDAINVNGTTFGLKNGANTDCAEFDGEVIPAETYYAVYPATATLNSSEVTFNLPASQTYLENSYASNLAPMAAKATDENLSFTNLCGLMELGLVGENITVTSLELSCDKPICGQTAEYTIGGGAALAMPTDATGKAVTMNCGEGVALNNTPTSFIFVLPPVEYGAFSLKVSYTAGANAIQMTKSLGNITIVASQVAYNTSPYELVGVNGTVTTDDVTNVTSSGANVAYTVTPNGVSQARQHGVCYGTSENPSISDAHTEATGSTYTASLTSLNANTTYHVRAYAIFEPAAKNEGDVVVYGEEKSFTTQAGSSVPEGFVDFGTHVGGVSTGKPLYWAKCNVGATNPQDYGDYYAWGFTTATTDGIYWGPGGYYFGEERDRIYVHRYCHNSYNWEYKSGVSFGTTMDNEAVLRNSDDVAYTVSDGLDRMPTKEEYDELKQKAYFVWTSNYKSTGVAGCVVYVSKDSNDSGFTHGSAQTYSVNNDEHIFLPAGGRKTSWDSYDGRGTLTKIWTKSLYSVPGDNDPLYAMALGMKNNQFIDGDSYGNYYQGRCVSINIRPVREGN